MVNKKYLKKVEKQISFSCNLLQEYSDKATYVYFYYFLQSKFKINQIYNYSPEKLHKITKVKINRIRMYISWLKKEGWVKIEDGHLKIQSVNSLTKKIYDNEKQKTFKLSCLKTWSFEYFCCQVQAAIIKINNDQQVFNKKIKIGKGLKKHEIKYLNYNRNRIDLENVKEIFNSTRQIAKLFNKSHTWAAKILKELEKNRLIRINHIIKPILYLTDECKKKKILPWLEGYTFSIDNTIFKHEGTSIEYKAILITFP